MLKAVLFDLDGTLVDSIGDLADSGNFALRQAGLPTFTDEEFAQRVGNGIDALINKLIPAQSYFDRVKRDFNAYYDEHCLSLIHIFSVRGVGKFLLQDGLSETQKGRIRLPYLKYL